MEISVKEMSQGERKEYIQEKIQGNKDWTRTVNKKADEGIISRDEAETMIARRMTVLELRKEIAEYKAKTDDLTGLYNRAAFDEECARLIKNGSKFALLIVDLDNFGDVNNEYTYAAGNSVIMQMGINFLANLRQLRENQEDNDFICRWGGDEFFILLKNVDKKENLELVANKFKKMNSERAFSVTLKDGRIHDVPAEFSMGGGIYDIEKKEEKQAFQDRVNEALHQAKKAGKNRVAIA
jgi:diguanylate cyclase (GGDEF)-like protein